MMMVLTEQDFLLTLKLMSSLERMNNLLQENADLFDVDAEIDSSLSYFENRNILADKLDALREHNPLFGVTRSDVKALKESELNGSYMSDSVTRIKTWLDCSVKKSKVYAVLGSRGSGKSCFSFAFAYWHHQLHGRKLYVYKFPKPELLPKFIRNVTNINDTEKGGVLIIDEAGMEYNQFSFNSKNSIELVNMLKVSRHKDLSIIFISQNGATLTRDIRRLVDCYILRNPSITQLYDEIPIIKRMYKDCVHLFNVSEEAKRKGFFISDIGEMHYFDLPEFWNDKLSKAYDGGAVSVNVSDVVKQGLSEIDKLKFRECFR